MDQVLKRLPEDGAAILLAHEPDFADISARTGRFDLQISGHTHGGQIRLPMIGFPYLPRFGRKYPRGLYKVGNMLQYTNRGVGMVHLPVRFNSRPEITLFTLSSEATIEAPVEPENEDRIN
jgi:predicted MPP superfamily phosphohydrolase